MSNATPIPSSVRLEKLRLCPFCVVCHTTENLELNHIDPDKPATIDNLIVVCSKHHGVWHKMSSRNVHKDLVIKGIKAAQKRGVHVGKSCADYENVMRLIAKYSTQFNDVDSQDYVPYTEHEIMDMANVKSVCYSKCKRMLKEAMCASEWKYEWPKPTISKKTPLYDHYIQRMRRERKFKTPLESR